MNKNLIIIGIIVLVLGLISGMYYLNKNKECDSVVSKVVQVFDSATDKNCNNIEVLMYISFAVAVVGIVVLTVGLVKE